MKRMLMYSFIIAMVVLFTIAVGSAQAKHNDPIKAAVPAFHDDGDGGGTYPYYTGYCGAIDANTPYHAGDAYYWSGDRRDKCYDGFMNVEFYNGSSWYFTGSRYD